MFINIIIVIHIFIINKVLEWHRGHPLRGKSKGKGKDYIMQHGEDSREIGGKDKKGDEKGKSKKGDIEDKDKDKDIVYAQVELAQYSEDEEEFGDGPDKDDPPDDSDDEVSLLFN